MGADMAWLSKEVCYGLFWGDTSILSNLETELLNYSGILCQGLNRSSLDQPPTFLCGPLANHWHALQSLGLSIEEANSVTAIVKQVAEWAGRNTTSLPSVGELAPDWE